MPGYNPPQLDRLVTITNPGAAAAETRDVYGNLVAAAAADTPAQEWRAYANRRDRRPEAQAAEEVDILTGFTIWTIREIRGIDRAATIVDSDGIVYDLQGPPVERGGTNGMLLERYVELHTVQRRTKLLPVEQIPINPPIDPNDYLLLWPGLADRLLWPESINWPGLVQ